MASEKIINIRISPTGQVEYEVKGIKGSSCVAETKFLDEALGGTVTSENTTEYYEEATSEQVTNKEKS